ncbi:MAG: flagellar export chaperone FlgN [Aeromicrobium sp.]|nr:flagellar export chaperone FlgN [Burkholderiales bacterium]
MDKHINPAEKPLRALLQVEYHVLCQYVSIAEQENNALAESDPDTITALAEQKLAMLQELSLARRATKHELGEPISAANLGQRLDAAGPGARDLFELIIAKAREAMEINRITARLVAHQTRRLEQRRAALSGIPLDTSGGYGVTGFRDLTGGYGTIGHA